MRFGEFILRKLDCYLPSRSQTDDPTLVKPEVILPALRLADDVIDLVKSGESNAAVVTNKIRPFRRRFAFAAGSSGTSGG